MQNSLYVYTFMQNSLYVPFIAKEEYCTRVLLFWLHQFALLAVASQDRPVFLVKRRAIKLLFFLPVVTVV